MAESPVDCVPRVDHSCYILRRDATFTCRLDSYLQTEPAGIALFFPERERHLGRSPAGLRRGGDGQSDTYVDVAQLRGALRARARCDIHSFYIEACIVELCLHERRRAEPLKFPRVSLNFVSKGQVDGLVGNRLVHLAL